jgi:DNA-binding CsgD family transcriptional regulator/energy-coupling factor transporter ATP-binding protein EcfA2
VTPRGSTARSDADQPLLEREDALRTLRAAMADAAAGQGKLVVLEGPAGEGKSTLVAAVAALAAADGMRVLQARGSELERESPFGAVRALFEPVLTAANARERARLLAGAAEPAEWALGLSAEPTSERAGAGIAALHAINWLTVNIAARSPLLIAVDDAHWADASSLRAFAYLTRRIDDEPVALLVALRPEEPGTPAELLDELRTAPGAVRVSVRPLGADAVARIVRTRIPAATDAVCAACHDATAGNPLYLEELLRAIAIDGATPDPRDVHEVAVRSLGERVERRIAQVAPEALALARAMAVLGDGTRLALAAALARVDQDTAGRVAHQLRRIEVLAREDPYAFVHPLVRRSVYPISVAERDALHRAAASLLSDAGVPPDAVAAHLAIVSPQGSTVIATALVEEGDRALGQAAPDEAARWLERALQEGAPTPARSEIVERLGMAKMALHDPAAIAHLKEAFDLTAEPARRMRIGITLAEMLMFAGSWAEGWELIESITRGASQAGDPVLETEIAAVRAVATSYDPAHLDDFDRQLGRYLTLTDGEGWAAHALAAAVASFLARRGDDVDGARRLAERAFEDGRLVAERGAGGWASAQAIAALVCIDLYERALVAAEEVRVAARSAGSTTALAVAHGYRGWTYTRQGDLEAAEVEVRIAIDIALDTGMPMLAVSAYYFLADAILERPSLDDVAANVEAMELDPVFATTATGAWLLELRGRLRVARGDHAQGVDDLRASASISEAIRSGPTVSAWRSQLALALPSSQRVEARDLIADELAGARASGLPRPQGVALRAAGLLEEGERGLELLAESVEMLESSQARLELARSTVELGIALGGADRRAEGRDRLMAGLELARRCGAIRLAARARDELRGLGGRARPIAATGRDALTASELRVARLATAGASNPEIAQELYVTLKTVETHLYNAYTKLGLSGRGSRKRLASALSAPD